MMTSGARGNRDQMRQLAGMRGLMAKPQKKLTGGIGEHDVELRHELNAALSWIPGLEIIVVPASEERMIAKLCQQAQSLGVTRPS